MQRNQAFVGIARWLMVAIWHILTKREPYRHFDEETLAHKMLKPVPLWDLGLGHG